MEQRIICITAGQRAGTTALQHAIALSGAARNYGEIFQQQPDPAGDTRRAFPAFARLNAIALADTMEGAGAAVVARRYLDWLRDGAQPKHVLIDVKLNSWFALSPAWGYPHDEPFFLARLKQEGAVIIFLWRRDMAEQILSLFISRELGIWHNLTAERMGSGKLTAPIAKLERLATMMCRSESDMLEHLADYRDRIVISYEELYREGVPGSNFREELRALTGMVLPDKPLRIRPNAVSKRDVVTNYDAAANAIAAVADRHRRAFDGHPEVTGARLAG
ncbi:MAG: hypothetical protein ACREHF_10370 [Rhizomicrobium sp.]